jgi:hypothetical protein
MKPAVATGYVIWVCWRPLKPGHKLLLKASCFTPIYSIKLPLLMHSLINNHPFLDGNKRTGITAAGLFLQLNGYQLTVGNDELESFTLKVASSLLDIAGISAWLKTYSQPIEQNPS